MRKHDSNVSKELKYELSVKTKIEKSKDQLENGFVQLMDDLSQLIKVLNKIGNKKINHPIYENVVENCLSELLYTTAWLFNVAAIIQPGWLKKNVTIVGNNFNKSPLSELILESKMKNEFRDLFLKTYDEMYDPDEFVKKFFATLEDIVSADPGFVKSFEERDRKNIIYNTYKFLIYHNKIYLNQAHEYLSYIQDTIFVAKAIPEILHTNRVSKIAEMKSNLELKGINTQEKKELENEFSSLVKKEEEYRNEQKEFAEVYGTEYYEIKKEENSIFNLIYMRCAWDEFYCTFKYYAPQLSNFLMHCISAYGDFCPQIMRAIEFNSLMDDQPDGILEHFEKEVIRAVKEQNISMDSVFLRKLFHSCRTSMIKIGQISQTELKPILSNEDEKISTHLVQTATATQKLVENICQEFEKILGQF